VERKKTCLPAGVKDTLPEEALIKRRLEQKLARLFSTWGYQEIMTPTFEYYETIRNKADYEVDHLYKFMDRDGSILALRQDLTTPIARLVATHYQEGLQSLRLFYSGNVYRHEDIQYGKLREFKQLGIELFGEDKETSDTEVIQLAIECLLEAEITGFKIGIGHIHIVNCFLEALNIKEVAMTKIKQFIIQKDLVGLRKVLDDMDCALDLKQNFLDLVSFHGGEEVLDQLKKISHGNTAIQEAILELNRVYDHLKEIGLCQYIFFDFSILRDFDYYTGIVFEGYAKGSGYPLLGGGRYNSLLTPFGLNCSAIGFALGLERILSLGTSQQTVVVDYLIYDEDYQSLYQKAKSLRKANYRVVMFKGKREQALQYGQKIKATKIMALSEVE
jgi:ATP phosphoribosyltransferase regulatory subunit